MFQVFSDGKLIGHSALEGGDPPMGCAEGRFFPNEKFEEFQSRVLPELDDDPQLRRWIGLSVSTDGGVQIECIGVALFELDFGNYKELRVDAIGIGYPLYEELFPGRHAAYAASFDQSNQ
ncbi:MAG: hypothetical protein ACSHYC_09630 [Alphaproteobacteria bacterium]